MSTVLTKKDFKILGFSSKNPDKVIIELDQQKLDSLIGTKKRVTNNATVLSWINDKDEGVLKSKNDIKNFLNNL